MPKPDPITALPAWIEKAARLIDERCAITLIRDTGDVEEIAAIAAIISAAAPTFGWCDIATAPQDGSWQLIARLDASGNVLWWWKALFRAGAWRPAGGGVMEPSHYLPLPPVKSQSAGKVNKFSS